MWDTFTCRIILNGIVVKVGCQRIFFPTADALRDALSDYIEDPERAIKRWRDTPFRKISEGCQVAIPTPQMPQAGPDDTGNSYVAVEERPVGWNLSHQAIRAAASYSDGPR